MTDSKDIRIANDDDLAQITRQANRLRYNRRLSTRALEGLDPDGYNILVPLMLHEHAAGKQVAPHMRARALIKLVGDNKPAETIIDVPLTAWRALPLLEKVRSEVIAAVTPVRPATDVSG